MRPPPLPSAFPPGFPGVVFGSGVVVVSPSPEPWFFGFSGVDFVVVVPSSLTVVVVVVVVVASSLTVVVVVVAS